MTNTDTADASTTTKQIIDLANAGSEIVRVTVDREDSAKMIPYIKEKLLKESDIEHRIAVQAHDDERDYQQQFVEMLDKYTFHHDDA